MEKLLKKSSVKLSHLIHNEAKQIKLEFIYEPQLVGNVREIKGIKWSKKNKCWYILNNKENLKSIFDALKGKARIDTKEFFKKKSNPVDVFESKIPEIKVEPNFEEIINKYLEVLQSKSYSKSTIKAHKATISNFIEFYKSIGKKDKIIA